MADPTRTPRGTPLSWPADLDENLLTTTLIGTTLELPVRPTGPAWLTGGGQGPEGSIFCTAFFLAGIVATAYRRPARAA